MPAGFLLAVLLAATPAFGAGPAAAFADALDTPARMSPRAVEAPVFALAKVDAEHVVGVGPRGHILRSADRGRNWTQQASPVSSDLVAVQFPAPSLGWAVGHDGVVLRSTDGGVTWTRQLDGRQLGILMVSYYEKKAAAGDSSVVKSLEDARRMASDGPTRPFLAVHFRNEREGWLVGQFNLILHTSDGGRTWEPWLDRLDNPDGYSLHAIRAAGSDIFIVGELGLVLRLDAGTQRFKRVDTPYAGSWFGVVASSDAVVATGLRGSAWRSLDAGGSWKPLDCGTTAAVNNGAFLQDGRLVLVTQKGELLVSAHHGERCLAIPPVPGVSSAFDVVAMEPGWLLVSGSRGVQRVALPREPQ